MQYAITSPIFAIFSFLDAMFLSGYCLIYFLPNTVKILEIDVTTSLSPTSLLYVSLEPVRVFCLQLGQNCSSQGLQPSMFPNLRPCLSPQLKLDPSVAFDTISHYSVHEILSLFDFLDKQLI